MSDTKWSNLTTGSHLCACMLEAANAEPWEAMWNLGVMSGLAAPELFRDMIRRKYADLYTEGGQCVVHPEGKP